MKYVISGLESKVFGFQCLNSYFDIDENNQTSTKYKSDSILMNLIKN